MINWTTFTLTYQLQQHTPYIHFQSEQKGATLRATELKPKLDKYLIAEYFKNDFSKYKHLLVGYKGQEQKDIKSALDYKVSIKTKKVQSFDIPNERNNKFPCFFANMGGEQETSYKKFTFAAGIEIEIFSRKPEILKAVQEYFPDFLMYHNFGTRQSKGLGVTQNVAFSAFTATRLRSDNIDIQWFAMSLRINSKRLGNFLSNNLSAGVVRF